MSGHFSSIKAVMCSWSLACSRCVVQCAIILTTIASLTQQHARSCNIFAQAFIRLWLGRQTALQTSWITIQKGAAGVYLVLHFMQVCNHQHLASHVDRADQLPGAQLSSSSETRLHGAENEADCKGRATPDHLLGKELHCPVIHLEGFAEGAGDGLQAGVHAVAGF
jgi:hypothetical protein